MKINNFEKFMIVFAVLEPIATVPQLLKVWFGNSTTGISLITWILYTVTSLVWLLYGFSKKDKPLIISGALWSLSQGLVVLGIIFN